jgi:hypothetical protein
MKTVNNKVEHTLGEWKLSHDKKRILAVNNNWTLIEVFGKSHGISEEEAEANAAFIVKAVNNHEVMLNALKIAREYVIHMKTKGAIGEIDKDLFKIEAAIKQAEQ